MDLEGCFPEGAGTVPTIFRCIMKEILRNLLVKAVMTEVPDLNGAEESVF